MKELFDYREKLLARLLEAAKQFRSECLAVKDPFAPLLEGGWNAHQTAAHIRDVDAQAYGLRARRAALEDNPEFQNFDGDAYAAEHYNANESLAGLLNGFVASVEALVEFLRQLPSAAWARESRHVELGNGFTLQTWVERDLAHTAEHLASMMNGK